MSDKKNSIAKLLEYQEKDKERLKILGAVEGGRTKRELDECNRMLEATKNLVLELDSEAKALSSEVDAITKSLKDATTRVAEMEKGMRDGASEEELNSQIAASSLVVGRLVSLENQLAGVQRMINEKAAKFDDARNKAGKAQLMAKNLTPVYEKQKKEIEPKVVAINAELKKLESGIDAKLLERYKKRRSQDKGGKPVDVAVKLVGDRCGGCHFELPLSQTHKVGVDGYIVCEECGKIIFN